MRPQPPGEGGDAAGDDIARARTPAQRFALGALAVYKTALSPLFYFLGARCRHLPTCSDYAAQAIARHGAWRGGWLAFARLSRCHPFGSHGFDPPPERLAPAGWRVWRYGDWSWTERSGHAGERPRGHEPGTPGADQS